MVTGINENKYRVPINVLDTVYPVGSIYMSVNATNPSAVMGGTWIEISQGRVLQGVADGEIGGDTKEAGLPNITGNTHYIGACLNNNNTQYANGVFSPYSPSNGGFYGGGGYANCAARLSFDASRSSAIYGASDTVQPPAFLVHIFQRTA